MSINFRFTINKKMFLNLICSVVSSIKSFFSKKFFFSFFNQLRNAMKLQCCEITIRSFQKNFIFVCIKCSSIRIRFNDLSTEFIKSVIARILLPEKNAKQFRRKNGKFVQNNFLLKKVR